MPKGQSHEDSFQEKLSTNLKEYRDLLSKEVDKNKNKRNLDVHNTTRINWENQIDVIDSLLDLMDEGEEIVST